MPGTFNRLGVVVVVLPIMAFSACAHSSGHAAASLAGSVSQGWDAPRQIKWYRGSQGSRLIPESWLKALEDEHSTTLFMDTANFARFNYLPAAPGEKSTLPIGFARDVQDDSKLTATRLRWFKGQRAKEPWVGLNCAACHTAAIEYRGISYRVDGAPTSADFQGFTDALRLSMQATVDDPAKWARFAGRIVKPRRSSEKNDDRVLADTAALRQALEKLLDHESELASYNQTGSVYGYARLDAVGHILNKIAYLNADPQPLRGEPDAPVSYPFIWNAGQHDFVQWNGLVPNRNINIGLGSFDVGALVRNTSEVVGVFADVVTRPMAGLNGYTSSVAVDNLDRMETQLDRLMSPAWPAAFGVPTTEDVAKGKAVFAKFKCDECHFHLDRTDLKTRIAAQMIPIWGPRGVGTDPGMVCNTFTYQARGGVLTGTKASIFGGDPLPAQAPTQNYLKTQAVGVLLNRKFTILRIAARKAIGIEPGIEVFESEAGVEKQKPRDQLPRDQRLASCMAASAAPADADQRRTLAYKARPLNGIWATAPYLHNGSVKSLYELLLPPAERATRFWVGNREFDVANVGFVDKPSAYGSWFQTAQGGQPIVGNSNAGHDYGNAQMLPEDRRLLVEYMKSL